MTQIKKFQWGGPSPYLTQLSTKSQEEVKEDFKKTEPLQYAVPLWGTALTYRDLIKDPSWENAGWAALSTVGDASSIFGVGELLNAYVAEQKTAKSLKAAQTAYETAHAATNAAYKEATAAAKAANKANAVKALKPGSGDAAIEALLADNKANKAAEAYLDAQKALDGYGVGTKTTQLPAGSGVLKRPSLVAGKGENITGTWKQGAEGVLDAAQNASSQAQQGLRTAAIKAPLWSLVNAELKVPLVVGKDAQQYKQGGYLRLQKQGGKLTEVWTPFN